MKRKETKTEFRYFTIMDYEKEAEYLRERHKMGWKITRVSFGGIYHFERCTPEDVVYQLDYNQEGIANKAEYVQMFQDCGWEYLFDYVGYSYFCKPVSEMIGNEEIFCDDDSRLDMMKRVFKGRLVPLIAIFFCIIIPQMSSRWILDEGVSGLFIVFAILFLVYLAIFVSFAIKYYSFLKRIKG